MRRSTGRLAAAVALVSSLCYAARVSALSAPESPPLAPQDARYARVDKVKVTVAPGLPRWYVVNGAAESPPSPAKADENPVAPARPVPRWYAVN